MGRTSKTMIRITQKIGAATITVEAQDMKEAWSLAGFVGSLPTKCKCGSDDISPMFKSPNDNNYYGLVCNSCKRDITFGQNKVGNGLFLRHDAQWMSYEERVNSSQNSPSKGGSSSGNRSGGSNRPTPPADDDDIPF